MKNPMNRRTAVKALIIASNGLIEWPQWANVRLIQTIRKPQSYLSLGQREILANMAETIIPTTETGKPIIAVITIK
jgi:hypothetical protein